MDFSSLLSTPDFVYYFLPGVSRAMTLFFLLTHLAPFGPYMFPFVVPEFPHKDVFFPFGLQLEIGS